MTDGAWSREQAGGKAKASGNDLVATVTFTTLPSGNSAFGAKQAKLKCDGAEVDTAPYEVFYAKAAKNHPADAINSDWPNWMYDWLQAVTPLGPPGIKWHYGASSEAKIGTNDIKLSDVAAGSYSAPYGAHNPLKGIDTFAYVVTHESQHYADFWSFWNNDFQRWADARLDDGPDDDKDGDMIPNKVEDVNLNHQYNAGDLYDWQVENTPTPGRPAVIINDFEDWNCQRHKDATGDHAKDWGNPGMQHGTLNKYDD